MLFEEFSSVWILTSQIINRSWHYCLNPENWYNHQTFVSRKLSNEGVRVRICLFYFGKLELSNNTRIHFKVSKLQSSWLTLPMDTIFGLLLMLPGSNKVQRLALIWKTTTFEWNSFCTELVNLTASPSSYSRPSPLWPQTPFSGKCSLRWSSGCQAWTRKLSTSSCWTSSQRMTTDTSSTIGESRHKI